MVVDGDGAVFYGKQGPINWLDESATGPIETLLFSWTRDLLLSLR